MNGVAQQQISGEQVVGGSGRIFFRRGSLSAGRVALFLLVGGVVRQKGVVCSGGPWFQ